MSTTNLSAESFERTITDNEIVLVDFWATWCGPCRMFAPVYEKAAAAHPDIDVARSMPSNRIVGSAETVAGELTALIERTQADEIMVSTMTHGLPERIRTLELVAAHWPG